jgi:hypothetical protein
MIDTIEKLGEYSVKELINLMNEKVSSITKVDTSATSVRDYMESAIQKLFSKEFEVRSIYVDTRSITITHPEMFFGLTFKLSTKSTGEIKPLTKLKSAYIKKADKVKFESFYFSFNMPCYNYNEKTKKGSIDKGWITSGENTYLGPKDLDLNIKIKNLNTEENFLSLLEKSVERRGKNLREYVFSSAFQPWIKQLFFNKKRIDKELGPYAKKYNIDKSDDNWPWHAALKAYEEHNPEMFQVTIDWIINDSFKKQKEKV